jgi:hypothetical protein
MESADVGRPARWPALLGIVFVVLLALRLYVVGAGVPEADASGEEVLAYYEDNEVKEVAASVLAIVAAASLVFFGAHVRRAILQLEEPGGFLAPVAMAGAVLLAAAIGVAESLHGALVIDPQYLTPESAKALNVLDQQFIFSTILGLGVFLLALGLASVRLNVLPAWLGWIGIVVGIAGFVIGYLAAVAALVWILVTSVVLYLRSGRPAEPLP